MIYAVTGKPGSGKSYLLVRKCKYYLEHGIDVYSNIQIDERKLNLKPYKPLFRKQKELGKCFYWQSLADFRYINNGIVLLDEAGAYFEPREWAKFSLEDRVKFQQHRKQRLDILLSVQNFARVDAIIRQLTNAVYECHKLKNLFWYSEYQPEEVHLKKRKRLSRKFYFFDQKIASAYDTLATVNLRERPERSFKPMSSFFS